jgi:hypothetical protein
VFSGAHTVIYSGDATADRDFCRDVLGLPHVDSGGGWLIFALPPAEVAMHPHDSARVHELYLICDDVAATIRELSARGADCAPVTDEGWGLLSGFRLPGGATIGFYQPRHARPVDPS